MKFSKIFQFQLISKIIITFFLLFLEILLADLFLAFFSDFLAQSGEKCIKLSFWVENGREFVWKYLKKSENLSEKCPNFEK